MALWLYGFMALWLYGFMALWLYGFMALWLYGFRLNSGLKVKVPKKANDYIAYSSTLSFCLIQHLIFKIQLYYPTRPCTQPGNITIMTSRQSESTIEVFIKPGKMTSLSTSSSFVKYIAVIGLK